MYDLTDFCLDVLGSTCVTATKYGAKWISDPSKYPILFNNKAVDKAIGTWLEIKVPHFKYLLDNCLKKIGRRIYQIIGITIELDPTIFMTNLFL